MDYSIRAMWQAYVNNMKCMYSNTCQFVDYSDFI